VETGIQKPAPVTTFGQEIPAYGEYILAMESVGDLLSTDRSMLVCVRSWDEYVGVASGYDYIKSKGRIAGSVWAGLTGSDDNQIGQYQNADHTMRDFHEIAAKWMQNGITQDKNIIFYCGTGWRASEAFFCAYLMGWNDIGVYDGGWLEWSAQPANLIEVGAPKSAI